MFDLLRSLQIQSLYKAEHTQNNLADIIKQWHTTKKPAVLNCTGCSFSEALILVLNGRILILYIHSDNQEKKTAR